MQAASSQPLASLGTLQGSCFLLRWCWKCHSLGFRTRKLCWGQRPLLYSVHIYLSPSNLIPKSALSVQPKLSCILTSLKPSSSVSVAIRSSLYSAAFWDLHSKVPFSFLFFRSFCCSSGSLNDVSTLLGVCQPKALSECLHSLSEGNKLCVQQWSLLKWIPVFLWQNRLLKKIRSGAANLCTLH